MKNEEDLWIEIVLCSFFISKNYDELLEFSRRDLELLELLECLVDEVFCDDQIERLHDDTSDELIDLILRLRKVLFSIDDLAWNQECYDAHPGWLQARLLAVDLLHQLGLNTHFDQQTIKELLEYEVQKLTIHEVYEIREVA